MTDPRPGTPGYTHLVAGRGPIVQEVVQALADWVSDLHALTMQDPGDETLRGLLANAKAMLDEAERQAQPAEAGRKGD